MEEPTVVTNFDSSMSKLNEKWLGKAKTDIEPLYKKADITRQAVQNQLGEAQENVEIKNHELVVKLKT